MVPDCDTLALVTYSAQASDVCMTMVDGKILYENGNYLTMDDISLSYGFSDLNATWIWNPTKSDRIAVDLYYGYDRARTNPGSTETSQYGMDLSLDLFWRNGAAAIHWDRPEFEQTLYYSGFALDVDLVQQTREVLMPSSISTVICDSFCRTSCWVFP